MKLLKTAYDAGVRQALEKIAATGGTAAFQVMKTFGAPALTKSVGEAGLKKGITPTLIGQKTLSVKNGVATKQG